MCSFLYFSFCIFYVISTFFNKTIETGIKLEVVSAVSHKSIKRLKKLKGRVGEEKNAYTPKQDFSLEPNTNLI